MVSRRNSYYPAPTKETGVYDGYLTHYEGQLCHRVNSFAFDHQCVLEDISGCKLEDEICFDISTQSGCTMEEVCVDINFQAALLVLGTKMSFDYLDEGGDIVYYADGSSGWIYVPIVHACGEPAKLSP